MKKGLDLRIAKNIVLAQIASDGGKGIYGISDMLNIGHIYRKKGYVKKDGRILKAIRGIMKSKGSSGFHFHIARCNDFYNSAVIVYFNFKLDGERYQISFHSFSTELIELSEKTFSSTHKCRWEGGYGGSRRAAAVLAELITQDM